MGLFDKCCFCIELRVGCLMIGYLNLVGTIIGAALGIVVLVEGGEVAGVDAGMLVAGGIFLLFLFILLAFNVVLLVGLHQNKRSLVRAYLIYSYGFIVLGVLSFFGMFAAPVKPESVISNLISLLLFIYFTLVLRVYHRQMDDGNRLLYNDI